MPTTKRASKKKQTDQEAGPIVSRPDMPGYGVPKDMKGVLSWSHVTERMTEAKHYWICTVGPEGDPHATPVDGIWLDGQLYFGGNPQTRRNRNLLANPAVCVHLESGTDVVIMHGKAKELRVPDLSLAIRLGESSTKKYGYAPKPEDFFAGGTFVFYPLKVLAWTKFPKDATRWQFQHDRLVEKDG